MQFVSLRGARKCVCSPAGGGEVGGPVAVLMNGCMTGVLFDSEPFLIKSGHCSSAHYYIPSSLYFVLS